MLSAVLLLAAAVSPAIASDVPQDWRQVETPSDSPYKLYVNMADVVHEGSARLFIAEMVPDSSSAVVSSELASVLVIVKIDCSANTIETQSASMVDQSGERADLGTVAQRPITAGTDDMMMRKIVCQRRQASRMRATARKQPTN